MLPKLILSCPMRQARLNVAFRLLAVEHLIARKAAIHQAFPEFGKARTRL